MDYDENFIEEYSSFEKAQEEAERVMKEHPDSFYYKDYGIYEKVKN